MTGPIATAALSESAKKDVQVFDALASRPRAEILERLSARAMSIAELERELRIPRVTLRYHLAVLEGQGLIEESERTEERRVGRPPKRYRATRRTAVSGYPRRRYDLLGELALDTLVHEVGEARALESLRGKGREVGRGLIEDIAAEKAVVRWTPEAFRQHVLEGRLRAQGSAVDIVVQDASEITYRSSHCPFLELAEKEPHLVCDALDVGYHEGLDEALGGVRTERLACMGHGAPYCEYRMRWRRGRAARLTR